MPVDTAGRLLEVLLLLASLWESAGMKQPLVLLSHVALTVLELARSQLEWLAEGLSKSLASAHGTANPFACRSRPCCAGCYVTVWCSGDQEHTQAAFRRPGLRIDFSQRTCPFFIISRPACMCTCRCCYNFLLLGQLPCHVSMSAAG